MAVLDTPNAGVPDRSNDLTGRPRPTADFHGQRSEGPD